MIVICDKAKTCKEEFCGGKEPHELDEHECGKCPKNREARCTCNTCSNIQELINQLAGISELEHYTCVCNECGKEHKGGTLE